MNSSSSPLVAQSSLAKMSAPTTTTTTSSDVGNNNSRKKRSKRDEPSFPVDPVVIQTIAPRRGVMNHSYRDFSQVPAPIGYECPTEISAMTFSQKVHHILSQTEAYGKWITWLPHGRSFKVHVPVLFETNVCPKYFGHRRYSSFLRELNNYGFKHISRGDDRNSYYHEYMLKDRMHLCQYMPPSKDARRLIPDPNNEPNFVAIAQRYPLDGSSPVVVATTPTTTASVPPVAATSSWIPSSQQQQQQDLLVERAAKRARFLPPVATPETPLLSSLAMTTANAAVSLGLSNAATTTTQPSPATSELSALLALVDSQRRHKQQQEQDRLNAVAALLQQQERQRQQQVAAAAKQAQLAAVLSLMNRTGGRL